MMTLLFVVLFYFKSSFLRKLTESRKQQQLYVSNFLHIIDVTVISFINYFLKVDVTFYWVIVAIFYILDLNLV